MIMLLVMVLLLAEFFIAICAIIFFLSLTAYKKQVEVKTNFNLPVFKDSVVKKKDDTSKRLELDEASKQSGTSKETVTEEAEDGLISITVDDDEYYEAPKAKSSIEYEEEPADNADIIQDRGEACYYESLAKQQERLENT